MNTAELLTVLALLCLCWWRNGIVYRVHRMRLYEIHAHANAEIEAGHYGEWPRLYLEFARDSYLLHMLDLTKWTYRQFYPEPPK